MAREINRLSPRGVAVETKQGMHADGGGLYLQVSRYNTKSWIFRFTLNGKSRDMGLGPIHTVPLGEARDEAQQCRKLLREGVDAIEARKARRAGLRLENAKQRTFQECAEDHINSHSAAWRNIKHGNQWRRTLETYAYPTLGDLPVQSVDVGLVMQVLEPIWTKKPETAGRVRGRIEVILDGAKARGYRDGENPARWRGHLDKLLPARAKVRKVKHHTALPYDEIGAFMADLRERDGTGPRALEFLILTAARTGEVIGAKWAEVDLNKKEWTVPAERTKADKEHRVPLPDTAMKLLKAMREASVSDYVFPGRKNDRPLSSSTFVQLLIRMGRSDLTIHGFRSTFRDWAAERTNCSSEAAEMALAHAVSDKVEAAYRRGDLFDKRRRFMQDWGDFCDRIPAKMGGEVVNLRG